MCRAELFNQKAAADKSKPAEVLQALQITPGQRIADLGAGGGYFTLRFAEETGAQGKVFAMDTEEKYLDFIKMQAAEKNLNNIEYIKLPENEADLPNDFFDLIFIRNVYHHLKDRTKLMRKYGKKLKVNGRLAIIEYRHGGLFNFKHPLGHNVPKEKIVQELTLAGLQKTEDYDFLPEQSFTVFTP